MSLSKDVVISGTENLQSITLTIKKPSTRYFDELVKLRCAPDLLTLGFFPNAKEVTESMAAFNAVRRTRMFSFQDASVNVLDVCCGRQPRSAALFAMRTKWSCVAVDPQLDPAVFNANVRRLTPYRDKIENLKLGSATPNRQWVVVAMHAHVALKDILKSLINPTKALLVAVECCQPLFLEDREPNLLYEDWGIWSPKRTIKVYKLDEEYLTKLRGQ